MLFRWVEALSFYKEKIKVKLEQEMLKKEPCSIVTWNFFSIRTCKGEEVCILQGGGNLRLTGHPLTLAQVPPHRLLHRSAHHNTQPSYKVTVHSMEMLWIGRFGSYCTYLLYSLMPIHHISTFFMGNLSFVLKKWRSYPIWRNFLVYIIWLQQDFLSDFKVFSASRLRMNLQKYF